MSRTLYALDEELANFLRRENFHGKFDVTNFVESLSERELTVQRKNQDQPFEPKPLIRDFEAALSKLNSLRTQIQEDIERNASEVQAAERAHNARIRQLNQKFENVVGSFESLEDMITSVGTTAIQIGKTLESLSSQLTRSQTSSRVVTTYLALRENDRALHDMRRNKLTIDEAKFVRNLLQVCREVDLKGSQDATLAIEKFTEVVEREVLADFDEAYRQGDLAAMRSCAETLYEFNGGSSIHRAFVNQHDFFIRKENIESEEALGADGMWQILPDPDAEPPGLEPGLISLFREIRRCVKDEFQIINQIFPAPATVKNLFLQRIFAQSIQSRLEEVLAYAESTSTLAYLRTLQNSYSVVGALVDAIKVLPSQPADEAQSISAVLQTNEEDLFVPYLESGRYIEKEKKSLTELYSSLLYKYSKYHNAKRNQKSSNYFDRLTGKMTAGRADGLMGAALFRLAGIERKGSIRDGNGRIEAEPEFELNEADGQLKPSNIRRMLKWHAEAVGRAVELSEGPETARDALILMTILLDFVVRDYLEVWLDRALDDLIAQDSRVDPDFTCLAGVRDATAIARLVFTYMETVLVPLSGPSISIRRDMSQRIQNNTNRVDGKINAIVQRLVDATMTWFASILSRQQKRDFKPKEDEINLANMQTQTNQQAIAFLGQVGQVARETLTGGNLEAFLTEIGIKVHHALLDHFKKFSVNATGGLLLTKDISRYQDAIAAWSTDSLTARFTFLHEIGNIFVVKPDVLRRILQEGELAKVKPQYLVPYVACREDYYSEGLGSIVEGGSLLNQVPFFNPTTSFG
ncbi:Putative uncharacterized protein [Taphrina deformans PYCC 5710]|uniref:Uncharacterized protein n=1 Tax=Taphrina deformans (strain PYCC 5710 / ATCC 11124 / CBS 356.35 / IMI 108563 / JCM 9778 / NBRC 8474) TaxID=1097556 RepID=R4X860_TAPDE|nr:Putative uncharacterized protein [Taphrina deformans PYCC 5710]|eukprot:CCG81678.1 Putative uncharacterized protein [Taphrina deformans PYCC 5710]